MKKNSSRRWLFAMLTTVLLTACGGADVGVNTEAAAADTTSAPTSSARAESTSAELIAAAHASGETDTDTALTHQVFALFRDPRLPLQYTGAAVDEFGPGALQALGTRIDTLAQDTRQTLAPFLRRPTDPGSWAAARTGTGRTAGGACGDIVDAWAAVPNSTGS